MNYSFWEKYFIESPADITIIGAGIVGLSTAISIKEKFPEKSVLIIERNPIPTGSSTRNAGFACFGSLTEIISDSEKMGWEKTLDLVKMRFKGLQKIQNYFANDEIDFELCGGYEILNDESALEKLDEVNQHLFPITKTENTFRIVNEKIKEFELGESEFLVENLCEGSLHSGKLLMKLVEKCHELKVEFLCGTEVELVSETGK